MERKYFSLEIRDDNKLTKVFKIIFGILCTGIAVFWLFYNLHALSKDRTLWITVIFLISFGVFQICSGFGYATRFIEFQTVKIRLKTNSVLPAIEFQSDKTEKITLFPLKAEFLLRNGKMVLLRFGITDADKIVTVKEEIIRFAEENNIPVDIKTEELS